jgi:hypothetical protein
MDDAGSVFGCAETGCSTPASLIDAGTLGVNATGASMRADSTGVYVAYGSGSIYAATLDGSPPKLVAQGQSNVVRIALDTDRVYWASNSGPNSGVSSCAKSALPCATPTRIVTTQAENLAVDGVSIFWIAAGAFGSDTILSCPRDGCVGAPLTVTNNVYPSALEVDGPFLYAGHPAEPSPVFRITK